MLQCYQLGETSWRLTGRRFIFYKEEAIQQREVIRCCEHVIHDALVSWWQRHGALERRVVGSTHVIVVAAKEPPTTHRRHV